jgi:hypothetical protein
MPCWRRGFENGADERLAVDDLLRVGSGLAFHELSDDLPLVVLWLVLAVSLSEVDAYITLVIAFEEFKQACCRLPAEF